MAHSCIFHAPSVELNIFSDWRFPLRLRVLVCLAEYEKLPYPYFDSRYRKTLSTHLTIFTSRCSSP